VIAESALYAQLTISLAHSAPATFSEMSTGTPAARNAAAMASLCLLGPITSSPRPWWRTWPAPGMSTAT
jgi:hypothetical protein